MWRGTEIGALRMRSRICRQAGQSMLEYAMIVVFVAMAGYTVWKTFGEEIKHLIDKSSDAVGAMEAIIPEAGR